MENWEQENKNRYSGGQSWKKYYSTQEKYGTDPEKQWSRFTEDQKENEDKSEFWDVVQNAVNTGDYRSLNKQVRDVINDTVGGISQMGEAVKTVGTEWARKAQDYANAKKLPVLYTKNPPGQEIGRAHV